jgi:hypothetical protein
MADLMISFPSDFAPIVGQQVTLTSGNSGVANPRITLLKNRAEATFTSQILGGSTSECELIAKVIEGGVQRGYLYVGSNDFQPDDGGALIDEATLRAKALGPEHEVTYSCVPPGSGTRMAIDRDEDSLHDGTETNTGTFVSGSDTGTDPGMADTDGDGFDDGHEVLAGTDPTNPASFPGSPPLVPGLHGLLVSSILVGSLMATGGIASGRRRRKRSSRG